MYTRVGFTTLAQKPWTIMSEIRGIQSAARQYTYSPGIFAEMEQIASSRLRLEATQRTHIQCVCRSWGEKLANFWSRQVIFSPYPSFTLILSVSLAGAVTSSICECIRDCRQKIKSAAMHDNATHGCIYSYLFGVVPLF